MALRRRETWNERQFDECGYLFAGTQSDLDMSSVDVLGAVSHRSQGHTGGTRQAQPRSHQLAAVGQQFAVLERDRLAGLSSQPEVCHG